MNGDDIFPSLLIIGTVGAGGALAYQYITGGWPFSRGGCAEGETKCEGDVVYQCQSNQWVSLGQPCDTIQEFQCQTCLDKWQCEKVFSTQAALDTHYEECHGGAITMHRAWSDFNGVHSVDYYFCRNYFISTISGTVTRSGGRPAMCTNVDCHVWARSNGVWVELAPPAEMGTGDTGALSISPAIECDALRFVGHAAGVTCGSWDPKLTSVSFEVLYALPTGSDADRPRPCVGAFTGWQVSQW